MVTQAHFDLDVDAIGDAIDRATAYRKDSVAESCESRSS